MDTQIFTGNAHQRGQEKVEKILLWLVEYQYSTSKILSDVLAVNPDGQRSFFSGLVKQGILQKTAVPTVREGLYLLTVEGKKMAEMVTEKALVYRTEPSRISVAIVRHNLAVQKAVLARLSDGIQHTFERFLDFADRDKLPDAVLKDGHIKTALEVELSHKKTARIFRAFLDHVNAIKANHYHIVEYVFPSTTLRDNYRKKFDAEQWPIIEKRGGLYRESGKIFEPDSIGNLRERFQFSVQSFDQ
nr:hypothetical protein [uncultured Desulfuromonas sp.]